MKDILVEIGAGITILATLVGIIKYVFVPHLQNLVDEALMPLAKSIGDIQTIIAKELQPNGTPLATKVAKIEATLTNNHHN